MIESSMTEIAVAAVTVAVGAAFYFGAPKPAEDGTIQPPEPSTSTTKKGKKNKKKTIPGIRATSGEESTAAEDNSPAPKPKEKELTPKPEAPPPPPAPAAKSKKKKKAKTAVPATIETALSAGPSQPSAYESSSANDGAWTRVETRRKGAKSTGPAAVLSDGLTTSVTGTEDEQDEPKAEAKQRTLAERLLPAGRKTGVEDMLETPQYPDVSRVMRVKPADAPAPAPGYSWGDYEDADENKVLSMDDEETDEGGWGVVTSRKPRRSQTITQTSTTQAPDNQAMSKKQRQNAAKRDAAKAAKAEAEEERLKQLQAHKHALERERIAQAYAKPPPGKGKASGGMTASVDEKGSLVWD